MTARWNQASHFRVRVVANAITVDGVSMKLTAA